MQTCVLKQLLILPDMGFGISWFDRPTQIFFFHSAEEPFAKIKLFCLFLFFSYQNRPYKVLYIQMFNNLISNKNIKYNF